MNLFKLANSFKIKLAQEKVADLSPLSDVLAHLRAAAHVHQTHHWQTRGKEYYADHLLFERLYNDGQPFIDQVAERAVGGGSVDLVDGLKQVDKVGEIVHKMYATAEDMVKRSLAAENMVLEVIKAAINTLSSADDISYGTSNLLEGIYDMHETFVYLLKQRNAD